MRTYVLKRLLLMVPTLLGVATLVFLLLRVLPGDVVLLRLAGEGGKVADEVLRAERARLGLDQALWRQYVDWIWGLVRGDLGLSMWTGRPVAQEIRIRMTLSVELTILATLLAVAVSIPLGTLAALRRATWVDYLLRVFSISGLSLPSFWLGVLIVLMLLRLFALEPAAHVHRLLAGSGGEPEPAHLARARGGLPERGLVGAHDALGAPRGPGRRLHPDRAREGALGARRRQAARGAERAAAGDHGGRAWSRR